MKNIIKRLQSQTSNGTLVFALMFANFLNFVFNAVMGRVLTLEQFSVITLANTLWFLLIIILNSFAATTTNRVAYLQARRGITSALGFRNYFLKNGLQIAFILTAVWIILIPVFAWAFHINDLLIFISISPIICIGTFIAIIRGYLQGSFSFIKAAIIIITEPVSKLAFALLLITLNLHDWVYLAIPFSIFLTAIVTILVTRISFTTDQTNQFVFPKRLLFATFVTTFSSAAFLTFDLLLARHFLSDTNSGAYALLSLVGKMVYFFGSLLNVFILSFASRDTGLNKNSSKVFYRILLINIAILSSVFVLLGLFGNLLVPVLFGEKSLVIIEYLIPYTFGIILFTISGSFAAYHLAKHQYVFAHVSVIGILLMVIGLSFFHNLLSDFVNIIVLVSAFNLCLTLLLHILYKDVFDYVDVEDTKKLSEYERINPGRRLNVSVCLPAYNEGKNIGNLLHSLLNQKTKLVNINKVVVVSSASTDNTNEIVQEIAAKNSQVELIKEKHRNGKASAINQFLKRHHDEVVVVQSADTLPEKDTIEKLCRPFLIDEAIGMTGGAPIPVNNPNCFLGFVVHTWWWFHRNIPRFGEIIAFRNVIGEVSPRTAVDEAYIQAKFAQLGYKVVHIDEARVHNKGSESIKDIIKQRRRIFNGHTRLMEEEHVHISHVTKSGIKLLFFEYKLYSIDQLFWLIGGIMIEVWANILGRYDKYVNHVNPVVWDIATTTKDLQGEQK